MSGNMLPAVAKYLLRHLVWTVVISLILTVLFIKWILNVQSELPLGPRGFPILGYWPFLSENMHKDFVKLGQKYGGIFSLKLGNKQTVVLNDFASIKKAFNGDVVDRHPEMYQMSSCPNILTQKDWKRWRRFMMSSLRSLGMGKNRLGSVIQEEAQVVLEILSETRGDINIHDTILPALNSIIIALTCGKRLKRNSSLSKIVNNYTAAFFVLRKVGMLPHIFPILKPFAKVFNKRINEWRKDFSLLEEYLRKEITSREGNTNISEPKDVIDHFFVETETSGKFSISEINALNGNCQLLLNAGNITTVAFLEWMFLVLAQMPDIQQRLYKEIVQVLEKEGTLQWEDSHKLPYLKAVLAENFRLHAFVRDILPRWTFHETKVGEVNIPKNSIVIGNLYSVHNDPSLWDKPEEFNPERFLSADGKTANEPEYLMTFGIGKRICIGEKLAREVIFIFVTSIIQRYRILPPSGGVNMASYDGASDRPKFPIVRFEPRI